MSELAVQCDNLTRVYRTRPIAGRTREVTALSGLSLDIEAGTVFGLLGPNGAGKTTTVRILSTLLVPTSGTARVLGRDVVSETRAVRDVIGLAIGGDRGFYGRISGRQNLHYFAALSGFGQREAKARANEVLELVRLSDRADERVESYSRGMRQRLHLARALFTRPRVLFLDEPTLGIDPVMAREFRALVPQLAREGTTVLLTTHYMLEADELCQRLAIIDHGRVVASGTPAEIKRGFGEASVVEATLRAEPDGLLEQVRAIPGVESVDVTPDGLFSKLRVYSKPDVRSLEAVQVTVGADNLDGIVQRGRTLEEAYLSILS